MFGEGAELLPDVSPRHGWIKGIGKPLRMGVELEHLQWHALEDALFGEGLVFGRVFAIRNRDDRQIRMLFENSDDSLKARRAREVPVILKMNYIRRCNITIYAVDRAHLAELRIVDAHLNEGKFRRQR